MATQFSGGVYVNTTFTGAVRSDIQSNLLAQLVTAGWTNCVLLAGQGYGIVGAVTISIASPSVVTWSGNHGFLGGERIILQIAAGGTMPTGLAVNTVYFVKYVNTTTHRLATTLGGADINTSVATSGVITLNTESILLQSATQTNVTNPIRVRLKDLLGNCINIFIENSAGTITAASTATSAGLMLPGAAKTFRIIATCYHFICLVPGSTAAREFVMAGMPYVPSFLASVTDIGYILSNSQSDTSTSSGNSPRTSGTIDAISTTNTQCIYNASLLALGSSPGNAGVGFPDWVLSIPSTAGQKAYRWANDDLNSCDVLMQWGLTANTDEGKIKGQFFDIIWIGDAFVADATDTFNGHDWYNLTSNNTGNPRGGFWVATS